MTTTAGCGVDDEEDIDRTMRGTRQYSDEKFDLCAFHELRDPLLERSR